MFTQLARRASFIATLLALPFALGAQSVNQTAVAAAGDAGPAPSIIDPSTTFHACYVPNSGTVYRIKTANTPATCTKPTHVEFSWSQSLTAEVTVVTKQFEVTANQGQAGVAECPFGTRLISGGYFLGGFNLTTGMPVVYANSPSENGWYVGAYNIGSLAKTFTVIAYASCLK
jgi:hypothetical protein